MGLEWKYLDELYREKYFDKDVPQVYLKSEADQALANKDHEIAELKKSISRLLNTDVDQVMDEVVRKTLIYGDGLVPVEHAMRLVVELRHHKYKRCLDNAWGCQQRMALYHELVLEEARTIALPNEAALKEYRSKRERAAKWKKRWLKIAEQFKDKTQWL